MFNVPPLRQRILLTIQLDEAITKENTSQFSRSEKADFLHAIALRIGKTKRQVQNIVNRRGLVLNKYPAATFLINEALSYYG